jgi:short-subunit dehydrogenase
MLSAITRSNNTFRTAPVVQAFDRGFAIIFDTTWEDETATKQSALMNNTGRPLAVVTGASSGIGFELAKQFAQHNFDLFVVAEDRGITNAAKKLALYGVAVESVRLDLADHDGVEELYDRISSTGRPVDAIAIHAGVGTDDSFGGLDFEEELNMIDLNVKSSVHLARRVVPDMVSRGLGKILFTSSIIGAMPGTLGAVYQASNAFIQSYSQAIRNELKDTGVTVTTLSMSGTAAEDALFGAGDRNDLADVAHEAYEVLMAGEPHVFAGSCVNRK